ncbi:MAG: MBL fold metallo-hydrolase [Bryobacteraceae bacterium]|nr:MBL fold metallo-hydrolase [Bryobacteraceae bacterium]MDW8378525.1 MBL fold metallo-hydrolase [Bryobacterales bacterium]
MLTPREVLPGAYQITLPLPFELSSVNVYLIPLETGFLLVDCGLGTAESLASLETQLAQLGVSWSQIREIFLTHTHPDHVGQAPRLLALTGAKISMHSDEKEQLARIARGPANQPAWLDEALRRAGVPRALVEGIEAAFARIKPNFPDLEPDRVWRGGEILETSLGELELIPTPGHSPGHLCLYSKQHRTLFCGDHMLKEITPNIGWLDGRDALGEFLASLERVAELEVDTLLPGHGEPFHGSQAWIAATKTHHQNRCEVILGALEAGPLTAHELVGAVWPQPLAPFHHRFAVFEVLAHLEHLRKCGRVVELPQPSHSLWSL